MRATMLRLALQLASDTTLAKNGCTLIMTDASQLERTGQTLAGVYMIECGRHAQNMFRACPIMITHMYTATTTLLNMPIFLDRSGLPG
ncbi:hypothetical protein F5141DRAFT_1133521 [Pisolithus sp. B1]|nr:hypothetical protein F5141DRAFT_1154457 [Pisolithus sp. B1]KAI6102889.1 hypothetical protein F5141DRAFT_1133521 [Pisolithus sp. B1]